MTGSTSRAEGQESVPAAGGAGTVPLPESALGGPISHAIFRVARLHRMIAGQLLRRVGLHPGQELVMMHLWERGPQRQIDLIRLLDSDAATMTRTVRRLEQAGFVRRRPSETDRRAVIVEPTAASHALRREVEQVWADLEKITAGDFTAEQETAALATMEGLERHLTRWSSAER
ncbi:MarR family winged helix-turn-helix transcriptional regulator [Streptomyces uncialis]|uniref:MarR family winged helix-turn-helix transcriptional regulator n=1 Tax=Streptomyces uncialis TaxID=1048205 RepID=UPI0038695A40|nr:MarR family winged helix-turn-helix transcriptional regulator [Streptomyces uncialis]